MEPRVETYGGARWEPVAHLLNEAYSERWSLPPLNIYGPDWEPVSAEKLEEEVREGRLAREGLFAATEGERLLSLAGGRMVGEGEERALEVMYVATRRERRRQHLAAACLEALETWGREQGAGRARIGRVDSRLESACAFLEAQGYTCGDHDQMSITMAAEASEYQPLPVELPPGCRLVQFRPGVDEQDWAELRNTVFGEPEWTPEQFRERFENQPFFDPRGWVFVENEQGRKIAMSGIVVARDETERVTGACVEWVGALPEYRGKKLGQAVVVSCLNFAKQFEPEPLVLITQYFRTPAVGLYKKLGFRVARELRPYEKKL
ncbi:MAG: GNAT family N-acetyltransferase [candidate division WS1 bacterium]|nr:GNAT family N-acetyltransferase [candidate division WS1 bacterium]